jgi:hypothetical protein
MSKELEIRQLQLDIDKHKAEYVAAMETHGPGALARNASGRMKSLQGKLSDTVAEGGKPCPGCDLPPMGMVQPRGYELGCSGSCKDRRAVAGSREEAVEKWNGESYLPPKAAPQDEPS